MERQQESGRSWFFRYPMTNMLLMAFLASLVFCVFLFIENHQLRTQEERRTAAEVPVWVKRYPGLYAPKSDIGSVNADKTVYLTFDGGPSDCTEQILEVLEKYEIKATFFVTGSEEEGYNDRLKSIADRGHTIGMLSDTGEYQKMYASVDSFLAEYQRLFEKIQRGTGETPVVCRFPGGSINGYNSGIYQELISEVLRRGFVYFDWNVNAQDGPGGADTAERITQNALAGLKSLRRPMILFHDGPDNIATVEALPDVILAYKEAGYTFASLTPEVLPVIYGYLDDNE